MCVVMVECTDRNPKFVARKKKKKKKGTKRRKTKRGKRGARERASQLTLALMVCAHWRLVQRRSVPAVVGDDVPIRNLGPAPGTRKRETERK